MQNGEHKPTASLDLDLLQDELVPVDLFFESYVGELERRSKRQAEGLLHPDAKRVQLPNSPLSAAGGPAPLSFAAADFLGDPAAAAAAAAGLPGLPGSMPQQQHPGTAALLAGAGSGLQFGPGALAALGPQGMANPLHHAAFLHQQPGPANLASLMASAGAGLQQPQPPLFPPYPGPALGSAAPAAAGLAAAALHSRGGASSQQQQQQQQQQQPGWSGGDGGMESGGAYSDDILTGADSGKGGGKKTVKQQEANKVAQQRYRERKKAKFHEMEQTIETLTQQLHALTALQSRNAILEGQNSELEAKLVEREREVERLKAELDREEADAHAAAAAAAAAAAQPPAAAGAAATGSCVGAAARRAAAGAAGAGAGGAAASSEVSPCDVLPRDLAGIDFKAGFSDQVALLRAFVEKHSLRSVDPKGDTLPRPLFQELGALVGRSCQLCQAALRVEGVKVIDLITKDPRALSLAGDEAENERWQRALDAMRLSAPQSQQLLMLRQAHLIKMRGIYEERQKLNLEAMALMLPHQSRNPVEDNTVEGRLSNISSAGYLAIARSNAELGAVLDKVKDNLRREQRASMDINCVTVSKILSPVQAALYMTEVYPLHCDALALTNVLARTVKKEELGLPPGRCLNADTCPKVKAGLCDGYNCLTLGFATCAEGKMPSSSGGNGVNSADLQW